MKTRNYGGGSLVYIDVLDDDGETLYSLEVGRNSGLVCLKCDVDYRYGGVVADTYVYYDDVTRFCGEMPEMVQNAILALFDGTVRE